MLENFLFDGMFLWFGVRNLWLDEKQMKMERKNFEKNVDGRG